MNQEDGPVFTEDEIAAGMNRPVTAEEMVADEALAFDPELHEAKVKLHNYEFDLQELRKDNKLLRHENKANRGVIAALREWADDGMSANTESFDLLVKEARDWVAGEFTERQIWLVATGYFEGRNKK